MTVSELVETSSKRKPYPPESIFEAVDETGKKRLFCLASFLFARERNIMLAEWPTHLSWEVTKEHFTQEEYDAYVR